MSYRLRYDHVLIYKADPEWNLPLFNHYASTIDAFAKYNNTLMYFVGNEVVNAGKSLRSSRKGWYTSFDIAT